MHEWPSLQQIQEVRQMGEILEKAADAPGLPVDELHAAP